MGGFFLRFLTRFLFVLLTLCLLVVGCGNSRNFVATGTATNTNNGGTPGDDTPTTGRVDVVFQLDNVSARTVKFDVDSFRLSLEQSGSVVVGPIDVVRSRTGTQQTVTIEPVDPGTYDLVISYFAQDGTLLGSSTQSVTVVAGQTTVVADPGYMNRTADFDVPRVFPAGNRPAALVSADFNGDGRPDLAAPSGPNVEVMLRNADGTFTNSQIVITGGSNTQGIGTADFNGDTFADLAVSSVDTNTFGILLGVGDGTFTVSNIDFSMRTDAVVTGEFTGDSNIDIAVTHESDNLLSILPGNGNGTFGAPIQTATGPEPRRMAAGMLDNNTSLDIVVANAAGGNNQITVMHNNGDGTFATSAVAVGGNAPSGVALGDLDGDMDLDCVTANADDNNIGVLLNNNGILTLDNNIAVSGGPRVVGLFHLDTDTNLDILIGNNDGIIVCNGNGDGTFNTPIVRSLCGQVRGMLETDFEGLGLTSIAAACRSTGLVGVIRRATNNAIQIGQSLGTGGPNVYSGLVLDVSQDGIPDLIETRDDESVGIRVNPGNGVFNPASIITVDISGLNGNSPGSIGAGDFNGDNQPDLAVGFISGNMAQPAILLSTGGGNFSLGTPLSALNTPYDLAVGDLNGDSVPDVLVISRGDNMFHSFICNGDGTFTGPNTFAFGGAGMVASTGLGDFDGDLDLDAVIVSNSEARLFLNNGDGTFATPSADSFTIMGGFANETSSLAVGDVTGDQMADAVLCENTDGSVVVLPGDGAGGFGTPVTRDTISNASTSGAGIFELDGDNLLDIVITSLSRNLFSVLPGNGDASVNYACPDRNPFEPGAGDLNGDQSPDVVIFGGRGASICLTR
jgi:FG-GAP-like repeat